MNHTMQVQEQVILSPPVVPGHHSTLHVMLMATQPALAIYYYCLGQTTKGGNRTSTKVFLGAVVVFYPHDKYITGLSSIDESKAQANPIIMVDHTKHTHTFQNYGKEVGGNESPYGKATLFFAVLGYTNKQVSLYSENQVTGYDVSLECHYP